MTRARSSSLLAVSLVVVASAGLPLPLAARGPDQVYVSDSSTDRVHRFIDLDGSGFIDQPEEITEFYGPASSGPDLSTPSHLLARGDEILLLDSGTLDAVLALKDLNGDGDALDDGEVRTFYDDESPGPNLGTANTLVLNSSGEILLSDDGSGNRAVLLIRDLDGNGDALGPDEFSVFYDGSALSPETPLSDIESLAASSDGSLYVGDSTAHAIYRLVDLNGDGDALDEGEAVLYAAATAEFPMGDIDAIALGQDGSLFVTDEDTGRIERFLDLDGDGDCLDAGEAIPFLTDEAAVGVRDTNDFIIRDDGSLMVLDGSRDTIFIVQDLNGDGDALDDGEVVQFLLDGGETLSTPTGIAIVPGPEAMSVTGIKPDSGPRQGGTEVVIFGSSFDQPEVLFGAVPAPLVERLAETAIRAITPPGPVGPVSVLVRQGSEEVLVEDGFRYYVAFIRGDVDGSGSLALADAITVLLALFRPGMELRCADAADANDDGHLSLSDVIMILRVIFIGDAPMPAPFSEPGDDPTPDDLACRD